MVNRKLSKYSMVLTNWYFYLCTSCISIHYFDSSLLSSRGITAIKISIFGNVSPPTFTIFIKLSLMTLFIFLQ